MENGFLVGQLSADQVVFHRTTGRQGVSHHLLVGPTPQSPTRLPESGYKNAPADTGRSGNASRPANETWLAAHN